MTDRWFGRASGLLVAAAMAVAAEGSAQATTIAELSVEQKTDASDYIIEGTVTEVWTELDERGFVWTKARVAVSEVLKGPDAPTELVLTSKGGVFGAYETRIEAMAQFSKDEELFAFVSEREPDHFQIVGAFTGKYTVRRAPGDPEPYLRTWHGAPGLVFDARFLPHVDPADRLYLSDLKDQVEARLKVGWDGKPIPGVNPNKLAEINSPERRHH